MTEEIIKGNALIAKFMGGEFRENLPYTWIKSGWFNTPANDSLSIVQDYDLKYHKSWDWIVPVAHKCCKEISELGFDKRGSWNPKLGYSPKIYSMNINSEIHEIWNAIVSYLIKKEKNNEINN